MQLYWVTGDATDHGSLHGTLADAHTALKAIRHRLEPYIDLIDVPTDKAGVLAILNDEGRKYLMTLKKLRAWTLTERGGLREEEPTP